MKYSWLFNGDNTHTLFALINGRNCTLVMLSDYTGEKYHCIRTLNNGYMQKEVDTRYHVRLFVNDDYDGADDIRLTDPSITLEEAKRIALDAYIAYLHDMSTRYTKKAREMSKMAKDLDTMKGENDGNH